MPILRYALYEGELLRYSVEVTVLEPQHEAGAEITLELPLTVGAEGRLSGVPRASLTLGPLAHQYKESFLRPVDCQISDSGLCLGDPGQPSPPYLPRFLEEEVEVGEGWGVPERGPEGGDIEVDYRLESIEDGVAELTVRKEAGPSLSEGVIRFSLERGRVLEAHMVNRLGDSLEMTIHCKLRD